MLIQDCSPAHSVPKVGEKTFFTFNFQLGDIFQGWLYSIQTYLAKDSEQF